MFACCNAECCQSVGKKLAVVEVCVARQLARARPGAGDSEAEEGGGQAEQRAPGEHVR